jgi:hypothetical protein
MLQQSLDRQTFTALCGGVFISPIERLACSGSVCGRARSPMVVT